MSTHAPDDDDDALVFADSDEGTNVEAHAGVAATPPSFPLEGGWTVLVVDDDDGIHQVTRIALARFFVAGHPVRLVHARTGSEARDTLEAHPDCALVLLDVVMETDDAGLRFVEWLRVEHPSSLVRVVLRTGQPGIAPEESVMARFDIHDYHAKTELSAQRLRTAVTGAVRAYRDLRTVTLQRQGLEKVLHATATLFAPRNLEQLLSGILQQTAALLVPREHAIFFLARGPLFTAGGGEPIVLAASGRYDRYVGAPVRHALAGADPTDLETAVVAGEWRYLGGDGLFGFDIGDASVPALFLEGARHVSDWERQTIALFCSSAAMALRNRHLHEERETYLTAYERFVPRAFLELLGKDDVRTVGIGDQVVRAITVLFVDVQGFTARSEALGPARVFALLNRIYGEVGPVVHAHGGVIDKYMGDGVMILFPEGPAAAVACARGIRHAMTRLNAAPGMLAAPIQLRQSLDHGDVILGTVGHAGRFDTTVISDVANVAARLQGWCRTLDVDLLMTRAVVGEAGLADTRFVGAVPIRGRAEPVAILECFEGDLPHQRAGKLATTSDLDAAVEARAARRWLHAVGALKDILEQNPDDTVARWMLGDTVAQVHRP